MKIPNVKPSGGAGDRVSDADLQRDTTTRQALDAMMSSSDQTYEQFLRGFSQLTAVDIAPSVIQDAFGGSNESPLFLAPARQPPLPPPPVAPPNPTPSKIEGMDELEEEILDSSENQTSSLTSPIDAPPKRVLKMDNFVDDEGASSDDDDSLLKSVGSEYIASFSVSPEGSTTEIPFRTNSSDASMISAASMSITNKVHSINLINTGTPEPTDAEELVYDPSLDQPNPGEVEDEVEETLVERAASITMITNLRDMAYSARPATPGETPSHAQSPTAVKLDVGKEGTEVVVLDEVEPFSLDDDFDYDNVILTPKFTPEEQTYLDELARRGKEERVAEAANQEASRDAVPI